MSQANLYLCTGEDEKQGGNMPAVRLLTGALGLKKKGFCLIYVDFTSHGYCVRCHGVSLASRQSALSRDKSFPACKVLSVPKKMGASFLDFLLRRR